MPMSSPNHRPYRTLLLLCAVTCFLFPVCSAPAEAVDADYRVRPGDVLQLFVLGQEGMSGTMTVGPTGTVVAPVIGNINAAGKTLEEIRELVVASLRDLIIDPFVTVALDEVNSKRRVQVTGHVANPGTVYVSFGTKFAEVLTAAGVGESSDLRQVSLKRESGETLVLDMSGLVLRKPLEDNPVIEPNDIIYVPMYDERLTIVGQVQRSGTVSVPLGRSVTVLDLIWQVGGGFTDGADLSRALLMRADTGAAEEINLTALLTQGDMRHNHEMHGGDALVILETGRLSIAGEVGAPLTMILNSPINVLEALVRAGGFTPNAALRQARIIHQTGEETEIDLEALWRRGDLTHNIPLKPGDVLVVPRVKPEEILITGHVSNVGTVDIREMENRSLLRFVTMAVPGTAADLTRVSIFRNDQQIVVNLKNIMETGEGLHDLELEGGDVIYVPDNQKVLVLGAFVNNGRVDYRADFSLMDYVALVGGFGAADIRNGKLIRALPDGTAETVDLDFSTIQRGELPELVKVKPGDIIYVPPVVRKRSTWEAIRDYLWILGAVINLL